MLLTACAYKFQWLRGRNQEYCWQFETRKEHLVKFMTAMVMGEGACIKDKIKNKYCIKDGKHSSLWYFISKHITFIFLLSQAFPGCSAQHWFWATATTVDSIVQEVLAILSFRWKDFHIIGVYMECDKGVFFLKCMYI